MRDISLTFDPPAGTPNTPAVSRRRRGWVSPDGQRSVVAFGLALAAHGIALWAAGFVPPVSARLATERRLQEDRTVVVIPLEGFDEAGEPPTVEAEQDAPEARASAAPATDSAAVTEEPAAPLPAPAVVPIPDVPLDFSDVSAFGSVTRAVVGAPSGNGDGVPGAVVGARARGTGMGTGAGGAQPVTHSLARPASTRAGEWSCPWPAEAMAADVYTQRVLVRVLVEADGSAASVSAVSDPGYGFAAAAEACARRESYSPALDDAGQPVRGTTPAIRVNFRR